ncbi:unnamed protein product [Gongylonema pulchrum]|uniref:Cysteine dioxygenase n=1 Tax=Gongylonema pulchrum TaxID=637853 RepID=A0A3P7PEE2_9BILA|nr:unnamed protein product [Gongylonema pulchrum]
MAMPSNGLRHVLREASTISEKIFQLRKLPDSITEIEKLLEQARQLVSTVTVDTLGVVLPNRHGLESMTSPMYYADIYQSEYMHVCLFGFKDCDFVLPLHDHPGIYGFVKVIRGAITVNSYTELPSHAALRNIIAARSSSNKDCCRFEGQFSRWSSDECVCLSPSCGNIHSIAALEDGAAFFDLLIPGYGDKPCTYYSMLGRNSVQPKQRCFLQKTGEPEDYSCHVLPYKTVKIL